MDEMRVLVVGCPYIDFTVKAAGKMPTMDEKTIAAADAISFGGNATTAAFCCAKLGIKPDLIGTLADDWLGRMFREMAAVYGVRVHERRANRTAFSLVMPNNVDKRAIVRCQPQEYDPEFPDLDVTHYQGLHLDGHLPDAALHYAKECRRHGIVTSLDGGSFRPNSTDELLRHIDVAAVSVRFCEQMGSDPDGTLDYLRGKGCRVGAVTMGDQGVLWYENGSENHHLRALPVPAEKIVDTTGAGDVFHGAYMYSRLARSGCSWEQHFEFAKVAAAHAVQFLGNEASLPSLANITSQLQHKPVAVVA